ncbi:MAG: DUF5658 family protein [Phycisphaerales bacterium]
MTDIGHLEQQKRLRRDRSRRVVLLIVGIVVLSLADLSVTLLHLTSRGMMEANPVAAWIIAHTGSGVFLTLYKAITVAICVGLLFHLRRHVEGEIGAWCAILIMAAVSFQWYQYTREIAVVTDITLARQGAYGEDWLILD